VLQSRCITDLSFHKSQSKIQGSILMCKSQCMSARVSPQSYQICTRTTRWGAEEACRYESLQHACGVRYASRQESATKSTCRDRHRHNLKSNLIQAAITSIHKQWQQEYLLLVQGGSQARPNLPLQLSGLRSARNGSKEADSSRPYQHV
jgi:hypothetical protein